MDNISNTIPNLEMKIYEGDNYQLKRIEGIIKLTTWSGFQSKLNIYPSDDIQHYSDGTAKLEIGGDMVLDNPEVTHEHNNAYNYVIQNQEEIKQAILSSLMTQYKDLQEHYGYDEEDAASIMPNIDNKSEFKELIRLSTIHILNISKYNIAYVGYEFRFTWDDEHALGIMTHKNRIVKIGNADTSFLTWIARSDLETQNF